MTWLVLAAIVLVAVAAGSLWVAFQRPDFVARLTKIAVMEAVKAMLPAFRRGSPADEAAWRQQEREGHIGDPRGREK